MKEHLVTFRLSTEEFGLDIMKVQEIIKLPPITVVPKAPDFVEGVINLRGNIIPVINLQKKFGVAHTGESQEARVIVIRVQDKTLGIVVDQVTEVLHLSEEWIEPPPAVAVGIETSYIRGVGKVNERLVILLDVERILDKQHPERKVG